MSAIVSDRKPKKSARFGMDSLSRGVLCNMPVGPPFSKSCELRLMHYLHWLGGGL